MNVILGKTLEFITAIPGLLPLLIAGVVTSLVFMSINLLRSFTK